MKQRKHILISIFICIFPLVTFGQSSYSGVDILELINQKRWFEVKKVYENEKSTFNDFFQLRTESYLYTHFNKPELAIEKLEIIANEHAETLKLDVIPYLDLLARNYASKQQYDKSFEIYSYLLKSTANFLPLDNINQLKTAATTYDALRKLPQQEVSLDNNNTPIPIDTIDGLLYIDFHKNDIITKAIFDTGANMNYASEETAQLLGIKTVLESHHGNDNKVNGKMGILDSFNVGNVLIKNALFFIVPSENQITKEKTHNLIIGTETMRLLKGIKINMNELQMTIYEPVQNDSVSNMLFDNGLIYLNLSIQGVNGIFQYDSGYTGDLTIDEKRETFSDLFTSSLSEEQRFLTVSDTIIHDYKYQDNASLKINSHQATIDRIYFGNTDFVSSQQYDGIIGKTIMENSTEMVFDFENMYFNTK